MSGQFRDVFFPASASFSPPCLRCRVDGESAAVVCPVGDPAAVSNLNAVALHLGPGSHVHPPAAALLLVGFKQPCFPVSRVRGGCECWRSAAAVEWTKSRTQLSNLEEEQDQRLARRGKCTYCLGLSTRLWLCLPVLLCNTLSANMKIFQKSENLSQIRNFLKICKFSKSLKIFQKSVWSNVSKVTSL